MSPVDALASGLPDRRPRIQLDSEQTADLVVQIARLMAEIDSDNDAILPGRRSLTAFRDLATALFAAKHEDGLAVQERAADDAADHLADIMRELSDMPLTVLDTTRMEVAA
jgi:hypothetical protein